MMDSQASGHRCSFSCGEGEEILIVPSSKFRKLNPLSTYGSVLSFFDSGQGITIYLRSFGAPSSPVGHGIHVPLKMKMFLPNVTLRGPEIGASPQQCDSVDDERSHSQILNHHCGFLRRIRTKPTLTAAGLYPSLDEGRAQFATLAHGLIRI